MALDRSAPRSPRVGGSQIWPRSAPTGNRAGSWAVNAHRYSLTPRHRYLSLLSLVGPPHRVLQPREPRTGEYLLQLLWCVQRAAAPRRNASGTTATALGVSQWWCWLCGIHQCFTTGFTCARGVDERLQSGHRNASRPRAGRLRRSGSRQWSGYGLPAYVLGSA